MSEMSSVGGGEGGFFAGKDGFNTKRKTPDLVDTGIKQLSRNRTFEQAPKIRNWSES